MFACFYDEFSRYDFDNYTENMGIEKHRKLIMYNGLQPNEKILFQVAFALACKPKFIIIDAPLSELNYVEIKQILEILTENMRKNNLGCIISTNDGAYISDYVSYVASMENGRIVSFDERSNILQHNNRMRAMKKMEYESVSFIDFDK